MIPSGADVAAEEAAPMLQRRRRCCDGDGRRRRANQRWRRRAGVARSSIGEARGGDLLRYKTFCCNSLGCGVSQRTRSDGSDVFDRTVRDATDFLTAIVRTTASARLIFVAQATFPRMHHWILFDCEIRGGVLFHQCVI